MRNIFCLLLVSMSGLLNAAHLSESNPLLQVAPSEAILSARQLEGLLTLHDCNPVIERLAVSQSDGGSYHLALSGNNNETDNDIIGSLSNKPQGIALVLDTHWSKLWFAREPKVLVCLPGQVDEYTLKRLCGCRKGWEGRQIVAREESKPPAYFHASYDGKRVIMVESDRQTLEIKSSDDRSLVRHTFNAPVTDLKPVADSNGDIQTYNKISITTSDNKTFVAHWVSNEASRFGLGCFCRWLSRCGRSSNGTYTVAEENTV